MPVLSETAFAKINLALHVRRRREDGYHELETIFAFADEGDILWAEEAEAISLEITGPFAGLLSRTDNLVVRVAERMRKQFGIEQGAAIRLEKNLPVASGIGGGSADAAATARLLNRLWGLNADQTELEEMLAPLGADIPACIASETAFGKGTGTQLRSISNYEISGKPVFLVNPFVAVATSDVFAKWDGIDRGELSAETWSSAVAGRNDLENPAIELCPEIANVLGMLRELPGTELVRMSGSGATCFAVFETIECRDNATAVVKAKHPDWWPLASKFR